MASLHLRGCPLNAGINGVVDILCCRGGIISELSFAEPADFVY